MDAVTAPDRHLLLVEDDPGDARHIRELLRDLPEFTIRHEERLAAAVAHLGAERVDLVLLDLGLPDSAGLDTLRAVSTVAPAVPVVVVTGPDDQEAGRAAVRAGAQDHLVKGEPLDRTLGRAIRYAIERGEVRAELDRTNRILRANRDVNQLIAREKDPRRLVERACQVLTETRGYLGAWVALTSAERPASFVAGSGWGPGFDDFAASLLAGGSPSCCQRAAESAHGLVWIEPGDECGDCPMRSIEGLPLASAVVELRHDDERHGFLGLAGPAGLASDQALVSEVAGDLAFAIHSIGLARQREHAGEELSRERDFSESVIRTAQAIVLVLDPAGRVVQLNPYAEKLLGCRSEELRGKGWIDTCVPERERERIHGVFATAVSGGDTSGNVNSVVGRDGRERQIEWHNTTLLAADGSPQGVLAVGHDITAYLRAAAETEALLRATRAVVDEPDFPSSARRIFDGLRELVGASSGYVALLSADGENNDVLFLESGGVACAVDPTLAMPVRGLRAEAYAARQAVFDNAFPASPHWQLMPAGHVPLESVLFAPLRADGRSVGLMGVANKPGGFDEHDGRLMEAFAELVAVSLREHRAAEALRRSEERYRTLVENLDDLVYSVDAEGRLTYVSNATTTYGFTPDEVMGRLFADQVHPEDRAGLSAAFARVRAGSMMPIEFRLVDRSGKIRFVRSSNRATFVAGAFAGLTGVLVDLTAQRETEEQLRAVQKMEAVGRLAGGVAHDFNNVLSVILSAAEFALQATSEGDARREDLEEIRTSAERAANLTRQLLAFSRRQVMRPEVLDLDAVVAETRRMLVRLLGENVELVIHRSEGLWTTLADRGQVEQVIMNLAVNARDAMPGGGRFTIATANRVLDEGFVRSHAGAVTGSYVEITLSDTGSGMDTETLARVFEPFFTTKAVGQGTGLGLAMVYGIVKQTGGSIWVESEVGAATTFTVLLPRTTESAQATASKPIRQQTRGGSETLLVVEDEAAVRRLLRRMLTSAGYELHLAGSGDEALALCAELPRPVDLLLTDVVMQGMGGVPLAAQLVERWPRLKVIFMSGYTDDAIVHEGVLEPGVDFLPKPFTKDQVLGRIRRALDGGDAPRGGV